MFNKSVFKQCIRSSGKMWLVFTFVACLVLTLFTFSYDASAFSNLASAAEGTNFEGIASGMGSLLGSLETYYTVICVLLCMVYVIITSSNLIVSEVDSGSMAYTLSTPIPRRKVVLTKMLYMVTSVVAMFIIIAGVGLAAVQISQHVVSDNPITEDVKSASEAMNRKESYVRDNLYIIKDDKYALKTGAESRDMDIDSYSLYLDMKMLQNSYEAAAEVLTEERQEKYKDVDDDEIDDDFIEITTEELEEDPSMILESSDAIKDGAAVMGMTLSDYKIHIKNIVSENEKKEEATTQSAQELDPETTMSIAMSAAAKKLDTDVGTITENMVLMKDKAAMKAEIKATGQDKGTLESLINTTMASNALTSDNSTSFDIEVYAWLNIGCCLLILAFSAIGFFAGCIFNRSSTALVFGGGLPFVFFIINVMTTMSENLEDMRYLTITTLFNTEEILVLGDFGIGLGVLAGISVVLYTAGSIIFCKKDLPL